MADFTPINQYGPRTCQRCNVKFDMSVAFEYVRGKDGSGRLCCPGCAKHYADRKATELMPTGTGIGKFLLGVLLFSIQCLPPSQILRVAWEHQGMHL
jgi:hypothetical protein